MWPIIYFLSLGLALAYGEVSQVRGAYAERRPELASLMIVGPFGIATHTCAGFVVDHETIASAARCLYEVGGDTLLPTSRFRFRVGSPFWNSGGTVYNVHFSISYILFHPSHMQRDIIFLGTRATIEFSDFVRPAVIGRYELEDGELLHTVGWGYITYPELPRAEFVVQHEIPQVAVSWEDCKSEYEANGFTLLPSTICTELENQSSITNPETLRNKCFGEAGGPVYHNDLVVGIRSFDVNCTAAIPTVSSKASSFIFYKENDMQMIVNSDE